MTRNKITAAENVRIPALTFDAKTDGWETSKGFVKRRVPRPGLDERKNAADAVSVIVRVKFAGVCGTDRGIWNRQVFRQLIHDALSREGRTLRVLGHEFVGQVVAAGSQVGRLYGMKAGDDVSGDSHVTCGRCFQCRVGEEEVCQDQAILGISIDGVFAPYVKIPAKNLWAVDFTRVRPEIAAMFDPFGNAVHACSKVDLRGKRIAVLGAGPIGLFTILLARAFGAVKIIAADINRENLKFARLLGADFIVPVSTRKGGFELDPKLDAVITRETYGKGVDVAFEMAGPNVSVVNAIRATRSGGHVVLFGLKDGDFVIPGFNQAIIKGLTLHGVIGRQIFNTWQVSQRMLSDRKNHIQDRIWSVLMRKGKGTILPFATYTPESFEAAMTRYPKILLKF